MRKNNFASDNFAAKNFADGDWHGGGVSVSVPLGPIRFMTASGSGIMPFYAGSGYANSDLPIYCRVMGHDASGTDVPYQGNAITQADVSSIECDVLDETTGSTLSSPTVILTEVINDTLQTDDVWSVNGAPIDSYGYNFLHQIPGSSFPTGGKTYLIAYILNFIDGTKAEMEWKYVTEAF